MKRIASSFKETKALQSTRNYNFPTKDGFMIT